MFVEESVMPPRHHEQVSASTRIGRGARSEVTVIAKSPSSFIARKSLAPHVASDPDARASVFTEADALSRIDHPNVVRLVGGDASSGALDLSLVEGTSVASLLAGGRLPSALALHVVGEASAAVGGAHRPREGAPIVHADLSFENLLVDFSGRVVLIDFDLSRAPNAPRPRGYFGHLGAASPELVRGEPIDTASDVFALGVLLWELLVGERLFFRTSLAATLNAIGAFEGLGADLARATAILPEIEGPLACALSPDRSARPRDAVEFWEMLPRSSDRTRGSEELAARIDPEIHLRWDAAKELAARELPTS